MVADRICSLLPSATEIVYGLGLEDRLIGVTHECDFPPQVQGKPRVTSSIIDSEGMSSATIDQAVRDSLAEQATIYHLDRDLLDQLQPDLVLTQELCDVCAVGANEVQHVVGSLRNKAEIVSLEPRTLAEVLESILLVGRLTGTVRRAIEVRDSLSRRLQTVKQAVEAKHSVPVLTLEWLDPLFVGGHWVPEMVELAGGRDMLGRAGEPSRQVSWREISGTQADIVIGMPCGFGLNRSMQELSRAELPAEWYELPAVKAGEVYAVDGSSYFNRPGPRLIEGVEILASILHPDAFFKAPSGSFARIPAPVALLTP